MLEILTGAAGLVSGYLAHRKTNTHYRKRWRKTVALLQEERQLSDDLEEVSDTSEVPWVLESHETTYHVWIDAVRGNKRVNLASVEKDRRYKEASLPRAVASRSEQAVKTIAHWNENNIK